MNLLEKINASIAAEKLFAEGERIVAAVSGGVDSMVLLFALHRLASAKGWRITVAHFNHQLRGGQSDADEKLVRRTARALKIPIIVGRGSVRAEARRRGWSIEMAARELRHQFLARAAERAKSGTLALAHHRDDQVELFFVRLLRGAGGEGLAGMKWRNASPVDDSICLTRPLLNSAKAELRQFATENHIEFSEDESNSSVEILRNRIRHQLLPLLRKEFQPALDTTILRAMDLIGAENEAARTLAREWLSARHQGWETLPLAVQRLALQEQARDLGRTIDFDAVERLRLSPDEPKAVGGGKYMVRNVDGALTLSNRAAAEFSPMRKRVALKKPRGSTRFSGLTLTWETAKGPGAGFPAALNTEEFDADKVGESIVLRHWRPGDRFQAIGSAAARKLQDVFTDLKTPTLERRRRVIATTADGEIFWVQGVRIGEACKLRKTTRQRLIWRWKEA
jgi:tRNA(Ile)-lysidine synthase